jgi:hypothetical protein
MMTEGSKTTEDETPPVVDFRDGRVLVDSDEHYAAQARLKSLINEHTIKWSTAYHNGDDPRLLDAEQAKEIVDTVVRAINAKRCGDPEGTVAVDREGRTARRYYSEKLGRNVWLITEPPSDHSIEVDNQNELPLGNGWEIVYRPKWTVSQ